MQFQVTQIDFDFEDDDFELPPQQQQQIYADAVGQIWEADDEDDLIEEITTAYGWCIKSIDYRHVLN